MGQATAQTVGEIERTRDQLETDLRELEQRLPSVRVVKRVAGVAAGGGVGGFALKMILRRRKKRKQAGGAVALRGDVPVRLVVQVVPDEWAKRVTERMEDGRWKPWAAGAAGAWVVLRVAQLYQTRKLARAGASAA